MIWRPFLAHHGILHAWPRLDKPTLSSIPDVSVYSLTLATREKNHPHINFDPVIACLRK